MDADEIKIRHLELVQSIVARMAQNSFMLKGWSVTLVGVLLTLAPQKANLAVAILACVSAGVFWALDGYFLQQEKLFRALYNHLREHKTYDGGDFFRLDTIPHLADVESWLRVTLSRTLLLFHGAVSAATITVIVVAR